MAALRFSRVLAMLFWVAQSVAVHADVVDAFVVDNVVGVGFFFEVDNVLATFKLASFV